MPFFSKNLISGTYLWAIKLTLGIITSISYLSSYKISNNKYSVIIVEISFISYCYWSYSSTTLSNELLIWEKPGLVGERTFGGLSSTSLLACLMAFVMSESVELREWAPVVILNSNA